MVMFQFAILIYGDIFKHFWFVIYLIPIDILIYGDILIYQRVTVPVSVLCLFAERPVFFKLRHDAMAIGLFIGSMIGICGILWDTIGIDDQVDYDFKKWGIPLEMEWNIPFIMVYMI